jgi:predicted dienelactone hydrolase
MPVLPLLAHNPVQAVRRLLRHRRNPFAAAQAPVSFCFDRCAMVAAMLLMAAWPGASRGVEPLFDVTEREWVDSARQRAVPVRLYLPRRATAEHAVPLVVFSHGIGGSRGGYSYLGRHWASQGYASLHLQHVGSDHNLWRNGNLLQVIGRVRDALHEAEAVARVQDLRFALDRLLESEFAPGIDSARIVAAGHSYGANTVLLAAGAQLERDGHALDLADPRIKAAIVISAPPFHGESAPQRILAGLTVPSLHITATEDVIYLPGFLSGAEDRIAVFEATGSARKLLAVFEGGSHSMFTDRITTGGAELNPKVKAATKDLSAAFLKSVFEGDDSALRTWPDRFSELVARYIGAER